MKLQRQGDGVDARDTDCITPDSSGQDCSEYTFEGVRHPSFRGGDDAENDIGLLHLKSGKLHFENGSSIPSRELARLYKDVWQKSKEQRVAGFGAWNNAGLNSGKFHTA